MIQQITRGIKISVESKFEGSFFKDQVLHHAFMYNIKIENQGKDVVQLLSRHWKILESVSSGMILLKLKPQYFYGNTLDYRYEAPTQFEGGNEYYFFDTKDLRITTPNIQYANRAKLYETYLKTDIIRNLLDYTYAPDINGEFEIRNIMQPGDSNIDADYSLVYFSLAYPYKLSLIHI